MNSSPIVNSSGQRRKTASGVYTLYTSAATSSETVGRFKGVSPPPPSPETKVFASRYQRARPSDNNVYGDVKTVARSARRSTPSWVRTGSKAAAR